MSRTGKIGNRPATKDGPGRTTKFLIKGLRAELLGLQGDTAKKIFADDLRIPLRTLNEIERTSALSFHNLLKLKRALSPTDFQKIALLCPPELLALLDKGNQKYTVRKWAILRWEVDVRIENEMGDAEYQTSVCIQNSSNQPQTLSPAHSVWAPIDLGLSLHDLRAYDTDGPLTIEKISVQTPTFFIFHIKPRCPIRPNQIWRYWWEISWPKGYNNLLKGDIFTYKGEALVNEVLIKIVLPKTMCPASDATIDISSGESRILPWLKIHGRDAIVLHRTEVPSDEIWNLHLKAKMT